MDLINTLEAPGEFDALTTLRPGEPYFLLVGRDRQAPGLVLQWARTNRERAMDERDREVISDEQATTELRKSTQAEQIAWGMQAYKSGHDADTRTDDDVRASGHKLDQPADLLKRDKILRTRTLTASALSEACAAVVELADLLSADDGAYSNHFGPTDELQMDLITMRDRLLNLADKVALPRPGINR